MRQRIPLLVIFLLNALFISACGDKMIGIVWEVNKSENMIVVDISEWEKRDRKGPAITGEGYSYTAKITDETVFKLENGTEATIDDLKKGQKVLVNPPRGNDFEGHPEEIILLEMSYEEKYSGLLSHTDSLNIVVMYEEGEPVSVELENIMKNIDIKTVGRQMPFPENYAVDYKSELGIEELPVILVFNSDELVFKTYNVDELYDFFNGLNE